MTIIHVVFLLHTALNTDAIIEIRVNKYLTFKRGLKDIRTQNVPTYTFFFKLAKQKGNDLLLPKRRKKLGVTVLVFEIMRCTFRRLRYFKMILAYNCQQ